jgi:hypothetical protein
MRNKFIVPILLAIFCCVQIASAQKVACVGNSITYGATVAQRVQNNYPKQLDDLLGGAWDVRELWCKRNDHVKKCG